MIFSIDLTEVSRILSDLSDANRAPSGASSRGCPKPDIMLPLSDIMAQAPISETRKPHLMHI